MEVYGHNMQVSSFSRFLLIATAVTPIVSLVLTSTAIAQSSLPTLGSGQKSSGVPAKQHWPYVYPQQQPQNTYPSNSYPQYPNPYYSGYQYPYNNGYPSGPHASARLERLASNLAYQSDSFREELARLADRNIVSRKLLHDVEDFAGEAQEFHSHLSYDNPDRAHVDRWIDKLQDKAKDVQKRLNNERGASRETRRDWSEIASLLFTVANEAPYANYSYGYPNGQVPGGYLYSYPRNGGPYPPRPNPGYVRPYTR